MVRFGNSQAFSRCVVLDGIQQITGCCFRQINKLAKSSQFGTGRDYTSGNRLHIDGDVNWSDE